MDGGTENAMKTILTFYNTVAFRLCSPSNVIIALHSTWSNPRGSFSHVSKADPIFPTRIGHIRDQVVPVLLLLETAKGHLGAGDVLLGVLEVCKLRWLVSL